MPPSRSAGIVLVRPADGPADGQAEVLLVHPGGPFWANRDLGAWSIPKGEYAGDDDALATAQREFAEELGVPCPATELYPLGEIVQRAGKRVLAWCGIGDVDPATIVSNTFEIEWPPRSGRRQHFPEVDRAAWFELPEARRRVLPAQVELLERAVATLAAEGVLPQR